MSGRTGVCATVPVPTGSIQKYSDCFKLLGLAYRNTCQVALANGCCAP